MTSFFADLDEPEENKSFFSDLDKKKVGKTRSLISAPIKGLLKTAQTINPMGVSAFSKEAGERLLEEMLPTNEEPTERILERAGKIAPYAVIGPEGLLAKGAQLGAGVLGGEAAEALGFGETGQELAEAVSMGIPGMAKAIGKHALSKFRGPVEKLPSGLTKPKAMEAKRPGLGVVTPTQQEKALAKLDKEASKLAEKKVEEFLPLSKQIKQGVDFKQKYEKGFSTLKKIAENAHYDVDIAPLNEFLRATQDEYRGIPSLRPDAKKALKEIKAFFKSPQTDHGKLLRIYRDNNEKISGIFKEFPKPGIQEEYVNFLKDMNRAIVKSFEKSFPEDSMWLKQFKDLNADYKAYKDTQSVLKLLKDVLSETPSMTNFEKFAYEPKAQQKLVSKIGQEGADQLIQLAHDIKSAKSAIKSLSPQEIKLYNSVALLAAFLPGLGKALGAKTYIEWGRRGYGWLLTTPARREAYHNILKSIAEKNFQAYVKAVDDINQIVKSEESTDQQ